MKIAKPLKIIGIIGASLLVLAIIVNIGINVIIKKQLPKIIEEKNDTAYELTYEDMNFSIFNNSLSVENAKLTPKKNANIRKDIDFYGTVGEISVSGVNFYELIKNKNLKAYTISVIKPEITVLKPAVRNTLKSESKLSSIIDIDKIEVAQANVKYMNSFGDSLLHEVYNFNAEINGIHMGAYTAKKDIPFTYTDYNFEIDSIYSVVNDMQIVKSKTIKVDKENIYIDHFKLLPYISSKKFKNTNTQSNTRLLVEVPKLSLKNTDWGYDKLDLFVNIGAIDIDSINVKILDQKNQTVFQQAKKDAEKIIQPLIPFRLDIESFNIKKSSFNSLGILDVNNVNIKIKKISNRVHQHLLIEEFQLNNPQFVHIPKKGTNKKTSEPSKLNDVVLINKVIVNDADYILKDASGKHSRLTVDNFNLTLNKIEVNDQTVLSKVPFTYENPLLTSGKIKYDAGKNYTIHSSGIVVKEANASIKDFKMVPKMSRQQHASKLKYGEDYYNLSTGAVQFNNYKWGFDKQDEFFIKFNEIVINSVDAAIYRDASKPNEPKENHLYSYKLRNLKFPFEVGTLKIKNSKLTYEEATNSNTQAGKLSFSSFNLTAKNIYSGYKKGSGPRTQINVQTQFMDKAKLTASWSFDIMDKGDKFNINGDLNNFPAIGMNPFLKPYMNVSASGTIDRMIFNFSGNNTTSTGDFAMDFKNLNMKIFNKEDKERKVLSAAANMVLRTDTDGLKKTEIKPVERKKDCSFFNFLWLSIMQGLKQTVI